MGVSILYGVYIILFIPIRFFALFTELLNKKIAGKSSEKQEDIQENFRLFLKESEHGGSLDIQTANILEKAINVQNLTVARQYIPMNEVLDIPDTLTIKEAFEYAKKHKKTSLPVYSQMDAKKNPNQRHNWKFIFNIYNAIYNFDEETWESRNVSACCSKIHTIDINDNILAALKLSRDEKVSLFVVVNHHGEETGILSPDDLAACLFGKPSNNMKYK